MGSKIVIKRPELVDWYKLNKALQKCSQGLALSLLQAEKEGRARPSFLKRIHSRVNRLRRVEERRALVK